MIASCYGRLQRMWSLLAMLVLLPFVVVACGFLRLSLECSVSGGICRDGVLSL